MVIEAQLSTDSSTKKICEAESDSDSGDVEVQMNTEYSQKIDDDVTYLKTLYVSSEEKIVEHSKELELPDKIVNMLSADVHGKLGVKLTTDIAGTAVAAPLIKRKTKDIMSSTQKFGEKFENCISRME